MFSGGKSHIETRTAIRESLDFVLKQSAIEERERCADALTKAAAAFPDNQLLVSVLNAAIENIMEAK
jgi:hypothetical protein